MRLSRRPALSAALCTLLAAAAAARADDFRDGEKAFAATNWSAARQAFLAAATNAAEGGDYAARYNAALSALADGDSAAAGEELGGLAGARGVDADWRAREAYNRGLAFARESEKPEMAEKRQELLARSVGEFKNAVKLVPAYDDARANYEMARRRLEELQQKQRQNQQQNDQEDQPDENKQDQQQQQQDGQDQQENGEQQQQQNPDEGEQQEQQQDAGEEEQQGEAQQPQEQNGDQMTEDEAKRLMDAMKEREEQDRSRLFRRYGAPQPVDRDW
jgi:cobalamin biosynthesis protein CobT